MGGESYVDQHYSEKKSHRLHRERERLLQKQDLEIGYGSNTILINKKYKGIRNFYSDDRTDNL